MAPAAVPRQTRSLRAVLPFLPEEFVLWEIVVRLPAKVLLRCRAVCRSWRRLTSTADFLFAHHRHQPSLPLVSFHGQIGFFSDDVVDAAIDAFDIQGAPDAAERRPVLRFNDYNQRRNFNVHGSCDGLLLLSLSNNGFYICNPATRQWTALPSLTGALVHVAGLYKHSSSGEYRILYWKGRRHVDVVYFILTVGSSVEPRCIGQPVASASIEQYITAGIMSSSEHPPALLRSCLHWDESLKRGLIVFDTIAEKFRLMHSPAPCIWAYTHLLEINDTLGINIHKCTTTVELWVLQDYEAEVWSLKYRIELPVEEMRNIANSHSFSAIVVSDKGDVLLQSCSWHMFHCDSKGKLQQKFLWDRVFPGTTGHWFKESLVKHVFFQKQDCGRVRQPSFFRGL